MSSVFKCSKCKKKFDYISLLKKHNDRKYPCTQVKCINCNKKFTSNKTLNVHIRNKTCIELSYSYEKDDDYSYNEEDDNEYSNDPEPIINKTTKIIKDKGKKIITKSNAENNAVIESLNSTISGNINNSNNNSIYNINNIICSIKMVKYGDEDMTKMPIGLFEDILYQPSRCIPYLIEVTNFDKSNPEYHSIYIKDIYSNEVHVFDGNKWIIEDRDTIVEYIIRVSRDFLIKENNKRIGKIKDICACRFRRFINEVDTERVMNNIREDVIQLLYEKREIPMKTKREINDVRFEANRKLIK